ncbi:hypothetical protein CK203_092520 [Vitis vinifera]|uniref:Uncharacterized protein n=1 Tax=Vitis vinifera TaxID=29760 RepID=A0A438DHQ7_VITVI|nr:hypothetical protein CK203_092520 [Vitis vinifera]
MLSRKHRKGPKSKRKLQFQFRNSLIFGVNDENKAPLPPTTDATIDYISSENLKAMPDPETQITGLTEGLDSRIGPREKVLLVLVKAMKNPRSALSKTSIMASTDIFNTFGDELLQPRPAPTTHTQVGTGRGWDLILTL